LTLDTLAAGSITDGFMMIPNATFYENCTTIAGVVDLSKNVKEAYYPEIEYWRAHRKKDIVQIHGNSVELTYRQAANWVNNLLNKSWAGLPVPSFVPAVPEDYNWT